MATFKHPQRGTWFCKFYYTDWTGKQKQKKKEGFKTKKESQEWERNFLNSCCLNSDIMFKEFCDKYLEHCKARLKPTTYAVKENMIFTKILPYFKKLKLKEITSNTIRTWQNKLITDKHHYAQTYLKVINNQMSAILNFGVNNDYISSNPIHKCGSIGNKHADKIQFWTLDEFNKFYDAMDDNEQYKTLFLLFFYSGIRQGEALALTLNDFDFENNTVSITKNYVKYKGKGLIQTPKTRKSNRVITIPQRVMDKIKYYASTIYDYKPTDRLFTCTKSTLFRIMARGCERSGVKKIRIHDLRHSHASLLINMGCQPLLVSERLGHENIETTLQTYSHLYPNKQQEIADQLNEIMQ